jgi:PAS domain S-box-containing protein
MEDMADTRDTLGRKSGAGLGATTPGEHPGRGDAPARQREPIEIIINSTHDGIIAVDERERITIFNRAAQAITGIRAEEALKRHIADVVPYTRLPAVMASREPELNRQLPLGNTTIITSRMPIIDDDGRTIGAFAVFRDISDAVELAEEITNLKETRVLSDAIFNSTQDAISVVDENGIHVSVNPAYTKVTGIPRDEVIGQPSTIDIAFGESIHREVLETRKAVHNRRVRVGPMAKEVIVDAAPIIVKGEVKGSVAVVKDLSEIFKLNSQLNEARRRIRHLEAKYSFEDLIGGQSIFQAAVEKARVAAATPATVLLQGESGTGKELFAHAIHNASDRREKNFVRLNCASLSEGVLESELFGYIEGAFTGAAKGGKAGLFEQAHGGTILLDEVGLLSLGTQAKLLRVLQEHEVRRVGATETIPIDTRVIAATNFDLAQAVQNGEFREDLYYRLNVIPVHVPALRDRREDIPILLNHLLHRINQEYGRAVASVSPQALEQLYAYPWPGNVRELENVLRRAVINLDMYETVIGMQHLPELGPDCAGPERHNLPGCREEVDAEAPRSHPVTSRWDGAHSPRADAEASPLRPLAEVTAEAERAHIRRALARNDNNRTASARDLGVSLRTLQYKLKRYGLS